MTANIDPDKIREFESEIHDLLEKYSLQIRSVIDFPRYKILPDEVQLAMKVIERHGGEYRTSYVLVEQSDGHQRKD